MATLDDKLLGGKIHNYCDSSDEEGGRDSDNDGSERKAAPAPEPEPQLSTDSMHWNGTSANTGPKGVIKDWQRFKQLETEKREEAERERLALIKKLSISARTAAEDDKAKQDEEFDQELAELMSDDFLLEFQRKRMAEMLAISGRLPTFGDLINLQSSDQLLDAIDTEQKVVTIILHIYDERVTACKVLNTCLEQLAKEYAHVKFCKINGSVAGMSTRFKQHGLPALLIYKDGQVIGNFIRVSDELGDEFFASDVESFLIEHALLPDKSCMPPTNNKHESDDDD